MTKNNILPLHSRRSGGGRAYSVVPKSMLDFWLREDRALTSPDYESASDDEQLAIDEAADSAIEVLKANGVILVPGMGRFARLQGALARFIAESRD